MQPEQTSTFAMCQAAFLLLPPTQRFHHSPWSWPTPLPTKLEPRVPAILVWSCPRNVASSPGGWEMPTDCTERCPENEDRFNLPPPSQALTSGTQMNRNQPREPSKTPEPVMLVKVAKRARWDPSGAVAEWRWRSCLARTWGLCGSPARLHPRNKKAETAPLSCPLRPTWAAKPLKT